MSPEVAHLRLFYRPPTSNPRLIENFTFIFDHTNEKIVIHVLEDRQLATQNVANAIGMSQVTGCQMRMASYLEVASQSDFKYPGNYTVTVYTNNAAKKRAIIPIIMPHYGTSHLVLVNKISAQKVTMKLHSTLVIP